MDKIPRGSSVSKCTQTDRTHKEPKSTVFLCVTTSSSETVSQLNLELPGKIRHYGWDSVSSHGMLQMTAADTQRGNRSQRGFTKKNVPQLTVLTLTPHWLQGNTGGLGRSECQINDNMKNTFLPSRLWIKVSDGREVTPVGLETGLSPSLLVCFSVCMCALHVSGVYVMSISQCMGARRGCCLSVFLSALRQGPC